ncbi:hypothetical protein C8R43DRAFT_889998, partial [Mycena crocata]
APTDTGEQAHDDAAIRTTRGLAIAQMRARGIIISDEENKMALGIFPKVAGLARRVHDSNSTLGTSFSAFVQSDPKLPNDRDTLTRRVPTRWNSDKACLESHIYFRGPIESLTAVSAHKLQSFRLTDPQWQLAKVLNGILTIFDRPTKLFSRKEVPLVHEIIPMIEDLERALIKVENASDLLPVVRVAAHAALLILQKYHSLTDDCEIYRIAIGAQFPHDKTMCPDKKLQWFTKRGWDNEAIEEVRQLVIRRWNQSYKSLAKVALPEPSEESGVSLASESPAVAKICLHLAWLPMARTRDNLACAPTR